MKINFSSLAFDFIALIAGGLLPLAFAPFGFYPLAIICPAILLFLWLRSTSQQAFWRGFLFGVGQFGVGVSWVYISIHQFGNAGIFLAGLITALLVLFISLAPAVEGYFLKKFFCRGEQPLIPTILAFASMWVLLEWVRSWIFTGFPWLLLGASQTASPLRGFAPLVGEYGLSFFVALSSALLVLIFISTKKIRLLSILLIIWFAGFALTKVHWTQPQGQPVKVTLIQGDIPQEMKWTREYLMSTLQRYYHFTEQNWDSAIIIWPETAIPLLQNDAQDFINMVDTQARHHNVALVTGIPVQQGFNYYNAMLVLGNGNGLYFKRHLVPFGEYIPLEKWFDGLFGFLNIPMSNLSAGPVQHAPVHVAGLTVAPFICYEMVYEQLVLQELPQANVLITISNDAWFGHSFASAQHLQVGQLRALETGRYHLFATNSGVTAIIDAQGNIQATVPTFQPAVLTGMMQPMVGTTPIVWIGLLPIIILMGLILLFACWCRRR